MKGNQDDIFKISENNLYYDVLLVTLVFYINHKIVVNGNKSDFE